MLNGEVLPDSQSGTPSSATRPYHASLDSAILATGLVDVRLTHDYPSPLGSSTIR